MTGWNTEHNGHTREVSDEGAILHPRGVCPLVGACNVNVYDHEIKCLRTVEDLQHSCS